MPYTSATAPIKGGKTAPPATAITKNEAPSFVCLPSDLIANANMVGNIMDIRKNTAYKAMMDVHPNSKPTTGNRRHTNKEYKASMRVGWKYFIIALPEILPIIKSKNPNERKYGANSTSKCGCISWSVTKLIR